MDKRISVPARVIAAAALVAAFVVAVVIVGGPLGGDSGHHGRTGHAKRQATATRKKVPTTYEVQSGDTLVAIAHRTGVPVVRIEALNPQVDPQILIAGETLKLRR
jgi:LysM repeat protein